MPMTKDEIEQARKAAMAAGGNTPAATPAARGGAPASAPNQSRLTHARAAIRPEMKGRVMLSGPAGAGKTYTALVIATTLVGPDGRILVIDSEKESSLTYADVFEFDHLRWNPPFDPTALSLTLKEAQAEYDAVIVDSFSHYWRKQGGVLDIAGDNVRGWKSARPIQENLIETILDVDMHVIVCCRSKMDHLLEDKGGGRIAVTKVGMKAQQDDDLEYEVNVALEIDMPHVLHVVKSRTNAVPVGAQFLAGLAGDFAQQYREWLAGGEPVAAKADTDALAAQFDAIEDVGRRSAAKKAFLAWFGRPEFLLVSRLGEAQDWVTDAVAGTLSVERAEDAVPPEDEAPSTATQEPVAAPAAGAPAPPPQSEGSAPETATQDDDDPPLVAPAAGDELGYCGTCGAPTYYEDPEGPWLHADAPLVDHELVPVSKETPKPTLDDLETVWAKEVEAHVTAEVAALSQSKLLVAIQKAGLIPTGGPKLLREKLVTYRLGR